MQKTIKGMLEPIHDAWLEDKKTYLSELDMNVLAKLAFQTGLRVVGPWEKIFLFPLSDQHAKYVEYIRKNQTGRIIVKIIAWNNGDGYLLHFLIDEYQDDYSFDQTKELLTLDEAKKECDEVLRGHGYYLLDEV